MSRMNEGFAISMEMATTGTIVCAALTAAAAVCHIGAQAGWLSEAVPRAIYAMAIGDGLGALALLALGICFGLASCFRPRAHRPAVVWPAISG